MLLSQRKSTSILIWKASTGIFLAVAVTHAAPTNVILFVGDGMGREHITAGRYFANGDTAPLTIETLTYVGEMTHNNASNGITDSAASATAMATGQKVNNRVISVALPGSGNDLTTALEIFQTQGKSTGLVTIDTSITDATPAAFGAHNHSRGNHSDIANDFFQQTRPNVLFGEPGGGITPGFATSTGYDVVLDEGELLALDTENTNFLSGQFNFGSDGAPTLAQMTTTAIDILDNDPNGFFLLVEHEDTDSGGHANNITRVVNAVIELDNAVQAALDWTNVAGVANETLIIVTADHETGGLTTLTNNGVGELPTVSWSTFGHTQTPVPVAAVGPMEDASRVLGTIDNTDIFHILTSSSPPEPDPRVATLNFQEGVSGFTGSTDTFLEQDSPNTSNGAEISLNVDLGTDKDLQGLLKFDEVFGSAEDQISSHVMIQSAQLKLQVSNSGDRMELHRMLIPWQENDTWNSLGGGIQTDDNEAATSPDTVTSEVDRGAFIIDVTNSLIAWQADPDSNEGWLLAPTGSNGVDFDSSEGSVPPKLSVSYISELHWRDGAVGDWNDAANWDPNSGPPRKLDNAWIETGGSTSVTVSGDETAITTSVSDGQLHIAASGTLTSLVTLTGGLLSGTGTIIGEVDNIGGLIAPGTTSSPLVVATADLPEPGGLPLLIVGSFALFIAHRDAC